MSMEMAATCTADEHSRRDELAERLRWLIRLRWVALAAVCAVVAAARRLDVIAAVWPLAAVALSMAALNLGFQALHRAIPVRTLRALSAEALMQIGVDAIGLGLLLFFSGGLNNPFVFFFCFHVVIAAILLEKRQAYSVALLTVGVVLLLGLAERLGFGSAFRLDPVAWIPQHSPLARFGLVFAISTTLLISVYMVTAIMERLRARSHDVRRLNAVLAERVEMLAAAESKLAVEHQRARAILECMEEGVVVVDLHGKVLLANTAAQQSSLLALQDTLRHAGCHEPECAAETAETACHEKPAADCRLDVQSPITNPQSPIDPCPMGSPAACLHDALARGGKLCPATLALLGADAPAAGTEAGATQARLTPPKSPTLAQVELNGRWFENTVSAVKTSANETLGLVVVSRDVTQRRSLERQVVHAEKLHALGNLAAGVAHELNTPLGTILGYAQMLLDPDSGSRAGAPAGGTGFQPEKENGQDARATAGAATRELRVIEEQARRCRKIVQGLLDLARKSSGSRSHCDPNDVAEKLRDLMAHTLALRGVALRLNLCEPAPRVSVAADELEQVLVNLVTNAADAIVMAQEGRERVPAGFTAKIAENAENSSNKNSALSASSAVKKDAGSVTIHTRPDPDRKQAGGGILIAVEDNGPGVALEFQEQIFEPFFTTKSAGRGTGLGLSIARRIVEDHQGTLSLAARADGRPGARFEIRLPLTSNSKDQIPNSKQTTNDKQQTANRKTTTANGNTATNSKDQIPNSKENDKQQTAKQQTAKQQNNKMQSTERSDVGGCLFL